LAGGGALADDGLVGALAGQQTEGAEQDAFAGAGLAGDDGETGLEFEGDFLKQGEVADAQGLEHGRAKVRVSGPAGAAQAASGIERAARGGARDPRRGGIRSVPRACSRVAEKESKNC